MGSPLSRNLLITWKESKHSLTHKGSKTKSRMTDLFTLLRITSWAGLAGNGNILSSRKMFQTLYNLNIKFPRYFSERSFQILPIQILHKILFDTAKLLPALTCLNKYTKTIPLAELKNHFQNHKGTWQLSHSPICLGNKNTNWAAGCPSTATRWSAENPHH